MRGFTIAEQGHIVPLLTPAAISAAATSDTISLANWAHLSVLIFAGAGSGCTITVGECSSFAGSDRTAVTTFRYAIEATHGDDVLDAALAVASAFNIAAGTGCYAVIELDTDQLTDGFDFVQVNASDPGTSKVLGMLAILSGGRHQRDITATTLS